MENKQYLYFVVSKDRLEQITTKTKISTNKDIYVVKVKSFHSYWHYPEFEFSTEIFAESQSYVLLRTIIKWYDHNIKNLATYSDRFCEIHYASDSFILTSYYTDKNLKDAFKDFDFKVLDNNEPKKHLYFIVNKRYFDRVTSEGTCYITICGFNTRWTGPKLRIITRMFAESQDRILLQTVGEWSKRDIEILSSKSDNYCEIEYGSSNHVNTTTYYTDENLNAAFEDYYLKPLDTCSESKKYLYFAVKKSALEKMNYFVENDYPIYLRVGRFNDFEIGCKIINKSKDQDPFIMLRSVDSFQQKPNFFTETIKSFVNDDSVCESSALCRLYPSNSNYYDDSGYSERMRYFTDEVLPIIIRAYNFEEKDDEDSPIYTFDVKDHVGLDIMANIIGEYVKNNKNEKENKDMPPYKHHINPTLYFGDCSAVHCGVIQGAKHITVKDIKFNGPATIIFYEDGSKEVVKCQKNDKNDKEKAIYMAMLKHKNKKLYSIINKALSSEDPEKALAFELIKYEGGDAKLLHQLCNDFIKAEKPKKKVKKIKTTKTTKKAKK